MLKVYNALINACNNILFICSFKAEANAEDALATQKERFGYEQNLQSCMEQSKKLLCSSF